MTTYTNTLTSINYKILSITQLVVSLAIVGIMSSLTHTFYLDHHPVTVNDLAKLHKRELETHSGGEYTVINHIRDPRHRRDTDRDRNDSG